MIVSKYQFRSSWNEVYILKLKECKNLKSINASVTTKATIFGNDGQLDWIYVFHITTFYLTKRYHQSGTMSENENASIERAKEAQADEHVEGAAGIEYIWSDDEIVIIDESKDDDKVFEESGDDDSDAENETEFNGAPNNIKAICTSVGIPIKFDSRDEAEYEIRLSQCRMKRSFKVIKCDERIYTIKCAHQTCNFFLRVSTNKRGVFVSDGNGNHMCSVNDHVISRYKSPASHCKFLAKFLRDYICSNTTSNKELCQYVLLELGCTVTPSTMNRALEIATHEYLHDHLDGFKLLIPYMNLVRIRGGYTHLETTDVTSPDNDPKFQFLRIFVSLKEQRHMSTFAEYVCLDASHLYGKFGGTLFCASTLNADGKLVILAQAIMPKEDLDNWFYFLFHFKEAGLGINIKFFMSDRDKGLMAAVSNLFPDVPHSKCLRHLEQNFIMKFGRAAKPKLIAMARCFTIQGYNKYRNDILLGKDGRVILEWIDRAEPELWCRALFPVPRYGVTTSNTIEIVWHTFRQVRHLPALELLLHIEGYVLEHRYKMFERAHEMEMTITPKVAKLIEEESNSATNFDSRSINENAARVVYRAESYMQEFSVNIEDRTCTCNRFQEMQFPCRHAVRYITANRGLRPETFCSDVHSVARMREMYTLEAGYTPSCATKATLHNIANGTGNPANQLNLLPPKIEVLRGRKRRNRIESQTSNKKTSTSQSMVCPVCNQRGHRRENCRVNNGRQWAM